MEPSTEQIPKTQCHFWRELFSDNGEPSSSRLLTFILSLANLGIVIAIVHHIFTVKDIQILALWLTSLPLLIGSLVGFAAAPYAINRSSGSVTDIITAFKK